MVDDVRMLFASVARKQRYLDVEAAVARAQGELGVIPAASADRIAAVAKLEFLDGDRMAAEERETGHSMMPLISELARVAGTEHGGWVHWGMTTQNIQQTGDVLGLRAVHTTVCEMLSELLKTLADRCEESAEYVLPGRTHWQQAVPITFGYKMSSWIDVLLRHLERLDQLAPRLFTCMTGGAAGTFATLGEMGPAVQRGVSDRLGLRPMRVPARNIADHLAEFVCVLGLIAATTGSVGEEIALLMSTEYGEVSEPIPDGDVGSSTMPQKRNPKLCGGVVTTSAQVRAAVPVALEAMIQSHEVDGAKSALMDRAVEQACTSLVDALRMLINVVQGLELFPDRMRHNLTLTGGLISAEAVMMALATVIGRQAAHAAVHDAARRSATSSITFNAALAEDTRIGNVFTPEQVARLLDPTQHIGLSELLAHQTAARARHTLASRDE